MQASKTLLLTLLLGSLGFVFACDKSEPAALTPVAAAKAADQNTEAPSPNSDYLASGPIVVENQVDVAAQHFGVITSIKVDVGQPVHKGELLALLDDRQLAAEREAAEAKLHSAEANLQDWVAETGVAEADYQRAQAMRDAGINTQEELDHAHYKLVGSRYEVEKANQDLKNAQATLRALDLELEKTHIEAPFEGVVARRYVHLGQTVAPGDRLFWLTALGPLIVKFTLPGRLISRVKRGEQVEVSASDDPSTIHPANIVQLSPVVDPASETFEVVVEIVGATSDLRPGMTANVRLGSTR
ncbi:MAG TPA: efflux RND transporter periplasmic adaptor subunit [Terriglobales bacterium]|nr:efflux RND transporter periplasmic adaptor subunit [Terriglobales bacterium]